jgi:hypothetical protein
VVRYPAEGTHPCLRQMLRFASAIHSAYCSGVTEDSFSGDEAAGALS